MLERESVSTLSAKPRSGAILATRRMATLAALLLRSGRWALLGAGAVAAATTIECFDTFTGAIAMLTLHSVLPLEDGEAKSVPDRAATTSTDAIEDRRCPTRH